MNPLQLHSFHAAHGARFISVGEQEIVADYGAMPAEYEALMHSAAVLDLSFRGRTCLTGGDRQRFLHGQVTNDINRLQVGQGCYAALVTAKGKMISDLNVYRLADEMLLDFEPGLSAAVQQRLERYIVSDDVQVIDVAGQYGLLSVQGPAAGAVVEKLKLVGPLPAEPLTFSVAPGQGTGDIYVVNLPRVGGAGFDLYVPLDGLPQLAEAAQGAAEAVGGRLAGWDALEIARVEAGIPRFGTDMDQNTLPPEAGLDTCAVSYNKGCYIGQEVINRIHSFGQVAKALRRLQLAADLPALPARGELLLHHGKEVGWITSAVASPRFKTNVALGYVRKEAFAPGAELQLRSASGGSAVQVIGAPFA